MARRGILRKVWRATGGHKSIIVREAVDRDPDSDFVLFAPFGNVRLSHFLEGVLLGTSGYSAAHFSRADHLGGLVQTA